MAIARNVVFLFSLTLVVTSCHCREFICEIPSSWQSVSLEKRVASADIVVKGKVERHYPLPGESSEHYPHHGAEVRVSCVFKGSNIQQFINVTNIGTEDCSFTRTVEEEDVLLLLRYNEDGEVVPHEPNLHSAAISLPVDPVENKLTTHGVRVVRAVLSVCGVSAKPVGYDGNCPNVEVHGSCVSGTPPNHTVATYAWLAFILSILNAIS